ncbi:hypothetical protein ACNKHN_04695 [Shigella flexneri]
MNRLRTAQPFWPEVMAILHELRDRGHTVMHRHRRFAGRCRSGQWVIEPATAKLCATPPVQKVRLLAERNPSSTRRLGGGQFVSGF